MRREPTRPAQPEAASPTANTGGDRIGLFRPVIEEDVIAEVVDVLRSGWLGPGPRTHAFETAFAEYVGARDCVAVSSCTAAIQLALHVLDLPPGTRVVTTPLTFVATNQAILHERLVPVFADVDPDTGLLDPVSVAACLSAGGAGAVIAVHYGGVPCDLDALEELCDDTGIALVEDAAHACGARYGDRRVGGGGRLVAFSFHAVKNLPMADGGALVTSSADVAARARRLRWFGITRETFDRTSATGYAWDYDVTELGFKLHTNDVAAALGLAGLGHLEVGNRRRAEIVERYRAALEPLDGIALTRRLPGRTSANHLAVALAERRDDLVRALAGRGVETGVHYRPSYDYALFASDPLPGVEAFWRRAVSLPLHLTLTDEDVERVIEAIAEGW